MEMPVVYLSKAFLISFVKLISEKKFKDISSPTAVEYLKTLLFERARVYINIEKKELYDIKVKPSEEIMAIEDSDERYLYGHIQLIGDVRSCETEIKIFTELECDTSEKLNEKPNFLSLGENSESFKPKTKYNKFEELNEKPNFLLLDEDNEFCEGIRKEFGIICLSIHHLDAKDDESKKKLNALSNVRVETVEAHGLKIKMSDLYIPPSHTIIIEDPYFFRNDKDGTFLESLLPILFGDDLKVKGTLTVISTYPFSQSSKDKIESVVSRIWEGQKYQIETYYIPLTNNPETNTYKMHDRNIYSNTCWISCGFGFMRNNYKPTILVTYPLGQYFTQINNGVKKIKEFVKNQNNPSSNNLLN